MGLLGRFSKKKDLKEKTTEVIVANNDENGITPVVTEVDKVKVEFRRPTIEGPKELVFEMGIDKYADADILSYFNVDYHGFEPAKKMKIVWPNGINRSECNTYRAIICAFSSEHAEAVGYFEMHVVIRDTLPPVIEVLKSYEEFEINSMELRKVKLADYANVTDNSGKVPLYWDLGEVVNFSKRGVYNVTLSSEDKAGNTARENITFKIVDTTPPVIEVLKDKFEFEINAFNGFDLRINDFVNATDNSGKCSLSWDIKTAVNFNFLGKYLVTVEAMDESGNVSSKVIEINIVDKTAPVLKVLNQEKCLKLTLRVKKILKLLHMLKHMITLIK